MKTAFIAALCAVFFTGAAEARQRHRSTGLHPECNVIMPCVLPYASTPDQVRTTRGRYIARSLGFGAAVEKPARKARKARVSVKHLDRHIVDRAVATVSGIVAPLAAKVAEIQSACGSRVVSAIRHTNIAGTRRRSLHATGQAVDLVGNPGCMYALLRDWPGGYSTDYARMAHLHLSYGGPEHGIRFVHGGGNRHARRYARHRHHRYASAVR